MYEGPIQDLIDELAKQPGLGPKGAQRIAFSLLAGEKADIDRLIAALARVRDDVTFCSECGNVSANSRCRICSDARRDATKICVVEEPKDVVAIERTREFRGRYHVLGGAINPAQKPMMPMGPQTQPQMQPRPFGSMFGAMQGGQGMGNPMGGVPFGFGGMMGQGGQGGQNPMLQMLLSKFMGGGGIR